MNKLQEILNTPDDGHIGYLIEVDLRYPDNIEEKTKNFPFCPENKIIPNDKYNDYMKKMKLKNCAKAKKLLCDWTDKKNYLVHYRMLKFYVRHGMTVDKFHEITSFKQSKWLEKYMNFNTQRQNEVKMNSKKISINYLITHFMERQWKM